MSNNYVLRTKRDYVFLEVSSALQKAIRRGDAKLAGQIHVPRGRWQIQLPGSR